MSDWEIVQQEASIVVVGNFNPRIFHPEWLISKGIVTKWNYEDSEVICVPDYSKIDLPDDISLQVFLSKLILKTNAQTNFSRLSDLIASTFINLAETPVAQLGMNFTSHISIRNRDAWKKLGEAIAPQDKWIDASKFAIEYDEDKRFKFGLWEITMNLPRPDDHEGYIRAKLNVADDGIVQFAINNHIDIRDNSVENLNESLTNGWESSLTFAQNFTENVMNKHLGD